MESLICGQMTNYFTSCQRRVAHEGQTCSYHEIEDEIHNRSRSTKKRSPKKKFGPASGTISENILMIVAKHSGERPNGLVSKSRISKIYLIDGLGEINPRIFGTLLRRMVEKGYLTQVKQSYRIGPKANEYVKEESKANRKR